MIGAYKADFGFAKGVLVLNANGHFNQDVWIITPPKHMSATGTWKFSSDEYGDYITFSSNYMFISNWGGQIHFDQVAKGEIGIPNVRYQFGGIQIGGDDIPWGKTPIETPYIKQ